MNALIMTGIFVFGALIGSFLNVVILRLPRGTSLNGRSQCPHCHVVLRVRDLIPVFSYIALGRKCRRCKAAISPRYALIELATAILFAWSWFLIQPTDTISYIMAFRLLFLVAVFIVIFVIDLEHYLILDRIVVPAAIVILTGNILLDIVRHTAWFTPTGYTTGGIIAAVSLAGFFFLLWFVSRGRWMGFGDVKLAFLLGLAVGWPQVLVSTMAAFFIGAIFSIILLIQGSKGLKSVVPFGTFLTLAALVALWYGPLIWQWYLGLIGL